MIASEQQLAEAVHAQGRRMVLAVTGGGSGAISTLLTVPGASRTVLAAAVPYATEALIEWLGGRPDEFCCSRTARAMAMAAFLRAKTYDPAANTCGVACTASLASDRPKRGAHRAHFACQTADTTTAWSLELAKGQRTRAEEEAVVAAVLLNLVAEAAGVENRLAAPLLAQEAVRTERIVAPAEVAELLAGRTRAVRWGQPGQKTTPRAVFPGAFDPLHEAHVRMGQIAQERLGCEVAYEISVLNVDKPPLDFIEIDQRARQFSAGQAVWFTRAPNFSEKAELFPGATFVVGADTISRVGQVRYYGGQAATFEAAMAGIAARGCRFLVFGRMVDGSFRGLQSAAVPPALLALCDEVPEETFRHDLSSTEIRRSRQAP